MRRLVAISLWSQPKRFFSNDPELLDEKRIGSEAYGSHQEIAQSGTKAMIQKQQETVCHSWVKVRFSCCAGYATRKEITGPSKCPYKDLAAPTDVFVDKPPS